MAQSRGTDRERAAERALCRHGAAVCRAETERALDAVESRGEVTPEQREMLRTFAERLSHRILAAPRSALAEGEVDPEALEALFD